MCYITITPNKERRKNQMGTEAERQDTRKAMAFDLINIIDENPQQQTYTAEEVKKLIKVYVATKDDK